MTSISKLQFSAQCTVPKKHRMHVCDAGTSACACVHMQYIYTDTNRNGLSGLRKLVENAYAVGIAAVPPEACIWSNLAANLLTLSYVHLPNTPAARAN